VPCKVRGKIIGRGVPGLVWSEDFVLQDESGIMFLDYRQPLAIWNFFFGLFGAKNYIGQSVEVTGWYRRAPVPFIEIKELKTAAATQVCYVYYLKLIFAIALILVGIIWALIA